MSDKQPIHPDIQKILDLIPPASTTPPDPAAHRAEEAGRVAPVEERQPQLDSVEELTATTEFGAVPVRLYTADANASEYGVIVYFHGGAFFSGSLDTHDHVARTLAKETGKKVISVGYSLAPEAAFPQAINECYGVVRWVIQHALDLKWDEKTLAVAGDSSGANFVAAVTFLAHDDEFEHITHQILYYPSVDLDFDTSRWPSLRENAAGNGLEYDGLAPFNSFYLDNGADPSDPLVSPIKRADLSGLPSALVVTAAYDPLRDEGIAYAEKLAEAGVTVEHVNVANANHGFLVNFAWIPEFHEIFGTTAEFLNR